jgi:Bacterial regulatory protein, arsR family
VTFMFGKTTISSSGTSSSVLNLHHPSVVATATRSIVASDSVVSANRVLVLIATSGVPDLDKSVGEPAGNAPRIPSPTTPGKACTPHLRLLVPSHEQKSGVSAGLIGPTRRIARLRERRLDATEAERAAARARALADPTRLMLACALREADELCVCDLAWIAERSQNLVSYHLRVLRSERLVSSRREERW